MEAWREDHLDALLSAHSESDLFGRMARMAGRIGFEFCAYGIRMPVPVSRPVISLFSNYSAAWQDCYRARGYLRTDPTVEHALKSNAPLVWSDRVFQAAPALWEEARSHGLRYGWAQAARDSRGSIGLLTLARGSGRLTDAEVRANQARLVWFAQAAHAGMARLLLPQLMPEAKVVLTPREREVLRWTAEGKTASEIAQILAVSERTVNFHINNVVSKFGALNKTQATVKAVAMGMLF